MQLLHSFPLAVCGRLLVAVVSCGVLYPPKEVRAQVIPAFSGADGAAAHASGGRGGLIYHVTKLNSAIDDPQRFDEGTVRYGLNDANFMVDGVVQPRTIVFDVGGVIWLGNLGENNGWDTQSNLTIGASNITIAGQTAPGGVTFMGGGLKVQGDNVIIRNITVAPGYGNRSFIENGQPPTEGDTPDSYTFDAFNVSSTNTIIDHVSTVYATDETISFDERAFDVTVQYSNISQGQNYPQRDAEGVSFTGHALGSLIQPGSDAPISIHHNLYAHQKGRLPRVGSEVGTGAYNDFRNNVFYNWLKEAGEGKAGQPSFNNFINNFYLAGPGGDDAREGRIARITYRDGGTEVFDGGSSISTKVFQAGNLLDSNKDGDAEDGVLTIASEFGTVDFNFVGVQSEPYAQVPYHGVTDSATEAYDRVLNYVGARWWERDATIDTVDERIINEVRTGTGKIVAWADDPFNDDPAEGVEWRALRNAPMTTREAGWDTDGDGMPDAWEARHGLDPNSHLPGHSADLNGDFDGDGYTNVEEYLDEVATWPAPQPIVFSAATNGRYAEITNWDIQWQPSRYDEAHLDDGIVTVDAVGQHAGVLIIGANAGDQAELQVTNGWLEVADELVIGNDDAADATLSLSGGELTTTILRKGAHGSFQFTGGVLHADEVGFDLENQGGTLAPGHSPGLTHVMGDLILEDGELEIEIGGTALGAYDRLEVDGVTQLGGTLRVELIDLGSGTYVPQLGDQFPFLASQQGAGGKFDDFDLPDLAPGLMWKLNPGNVTVFLDVVAVPEPTTSGLTALAICSMFVCRITRPCRRIPSPMGGGRTMHEEQ